MSQAKVDRYKEEKANRKEIMRKRKMQDNMRSAVLGLVALVLVGWIGYSAWGVYEDAQPRDVVEIDYDAIDTYLNEL